MVQVARLSSEELRSNVFVSIKMRIGSLDPTHAHRATILYQLLSCDYNRHDRLKHPQSINQFQLCNHISLKCSPPRKSTCSMYRVCPNVMYLLKLMAWSNNDTYVLLGVHFFQMYPLSFCSPYSSWTDDDSYILCTLEKTHGTRHQPLAK